MCLKSSGGRSAALGFHRTVMGDNPEKRAQSSTSLVLHLRSACFFILPGPSKRAISPGTCSGLFLPAPQLSSHPRHPAASPTSLPYGRLSPPPMAVSLPLMAASPPLTGGLFHQGQPLPSWWPLSTWRPLPPHLLHPSTYRGSGRNLRAYGRLTLPSRTLGF